MLCPWVPAATGKLSSEGPEFLLWLKIRAGRTGRSDLSPVMLDNECIEQNMFLCLHQTIHFHTHPFTSLKHTADFSLNCIQTQVFALIVKCTMETISSNTHQTNLMFKLFNVTQLFLVLKGKMHMTIKQLPVLNEAPPQESIKPSAEFPYHVFNFPFAPGHESWFPLFLC